ncbi:hypothetical protein ASE35_14505 [Lysobacter sp. Root916]|uniref:hypothetical protein n=1 Tax=Lysobacter sp. Root916 TaxID=1736606 RepID=UPI000710C832|nr:hypothetical protein [Lysobacter sp. Root916]KRD32145.1 hypothetical protein ASE35_14505 [Lysobacter sp. Root916]
MRGVGSALGALLIGAVVGAYVATERGSSQEAILVGAGVGGACGLVFFGCGGILGCALSAIKVLRKDASIDQLRMWLEGYLAMGISLALGVVALAAVFFFWV